MLFCLADMTNMLPTKQQLWLKIVTGVGGKINPRANERPRV